ncbi:MULTISPECIES: FUN14 domain-containing protein [Thermococcus]|uniref:FUN14 family protein n=2 Tax=Thermococcus sibiricus TaxID=172049 RepID=C6A1H6_THESM|nr:MULTISPECIES: FUN14 domain-containing protein [Thermococcus]KUK28954.1 MAG: Uncharacterized protein XD61_0513 [Thermococcus sp. 40_45]HII67157.1 hypothetical protein [Thermococcaceae archaeon]ACS89471.1 hypothetical protein TSIB_0405 [Thermococcus sibiricus MM 739]KUK17671.1 MAG: Uncharacterized protein XD54_1036 [Thermococcus sibiricus]MBC7094693.1 hypothetical protein [Thermococcus sp.]
MNFDFSGIMGDMSIGAVVGFITGYALKKFIKIVLTLIGVYLLSLFWLQQKGVITINTDALFNLAESATTSTLTLADKVVGILPGTGAFVAGFYLGFRKG